MADSVQYKSLPEVLYCKTCNYYTCNKKQIEKHFLSNKHIKNNSSVPPVAPSPSPPTELQTDTLSSDLEVPSAPPNTPNPMICECCGKIYKRKRALIRHQEQKLQELIKDDISSLSDSDIDKNNDQANIDKSLELITDDDDDDYSSSNAEADYTSFNPLIINHDIVYFLHAFMYSTHFIMMIYIYINKIFSFFSLKSCDDSDL